MSSRRPPPRSPSSGDRAPCAAGDGPPSARERALQSPTYGRLRHRVRRPRPRPGIAQDWRTGEVLTLAYMNDEALERTRETGEMWFWSRSREELWHKGETSRQRAELQRAAPRLRRRRAARARRAGRPGVPHGRAHLLPQRRPDPARREALPALERTIAERAPRPTPRLLHRDAARRPPARRARRSGRRPRRWRARRARRPTSASPRRPPTCSTTWPCCCAAAGWPADADACSMTRSC